MKQLYIILISLISTSLFAQPSLLWSKDYEAGMTYYFSKAPTIKAVADTFEVTGIINTENGQRLRTVVYDLQGEMVNTVYFEPGITNTVIVDYQSDSANQVYIAMKEFVGFYKSKLVFQKYASDGSLIWTRKFEDDAAISYQPHSIGFTSGNCIFVLGYREFNYPEEPTDAIMTTSQPYLYAFNPNGDLLWQREFNISDFDYFQHSLFVYNESAFLFTINATLIKVDSNNNLTQNNTIGIYDGIKDIQLTPDNNLLITPNNLKFKYTKADLNGSSFYTREYYTFLPSNHHGDDIHSFVQDIEGNIYFTGRHYGQNMGTPAYTNADILTLKYSPSGVLIWQNRYQYGGNNADIGNCITLKDGYVYVGGNSQRLGVTTDYDYVAIKIDAASGETDQVYRYNGQANGDDSVSSISVLDNGNFALTGLSYIAGQHDWTTQFIEESLGVPEHGTLTLSLITPNPAAAGSTLTVNGNQYRHYTLISPLGQTVQSGEFNETNSQTIRIGNLTPGIYILNLGSETQKAIKKLIVK